MLPHRPPWTAIPTAEEPVVLRSTLARGSGLPLIVALACGAVEVVEAPALGHLDVQLEQGWWAGRPASALPLQNGYTHAPGSQRAGSQEQEAGSPHSHIGSAGLTFKCVTLRRACPYHWRFAAVKLLFWWLRVLKTVS